MRLEKKSGAGVFFVIVVVMAALASALTWDVSDFESFLDEEEVFYYNFTKNVSDVDGDVSIAVETDAEKNKVVWNNGTEVSNFTGIDSFSWITLSEGVLKINATDDNQTGRFSIPIQASDGSDPGDSEWFYYTINATNDAVNVTNISTNYIYPSDGAGNYYNITALDEEEHYPLNFSITFLDNCTYASWIDKNDGENCSIFDVVNDSLNTAYLNYTGEIDDVGRYWAVVNVSEAEHYCPHEYCVNDTYSVVTSQSYNISVDVNSRMLVNTSPCQDVNFSEGEAKNCTILVRTKTESQTFNLTSSADFTNYHAGTPSNSSWFYQLTEHTSSSFTKEINITVNATHSQVGYWDINLTAYLFNGSANDYDYDILPIFVNRTRDFPGTISGMSSDYSISGGVDTVVDFEVIDSDYLIEDKDYYDESASISVLVVNQSSGSEVSDFYSVVRQSVTSDREEFDIVFSPTVAQHGNYTVQVNSSDAGGNTDSFSFNLSVVDNDYPYWNSSEYSFNLTVNSTKTTTLSNISALNLSRSYANDSDLEDILEFDTSGVIPENLELSSEGILNFFPWKEDVGYWEFNISVSDDWNLTNSSVWKINVSNVNSAPEIKNSTFTVNNVNEFDSTVNQSEVNNISFIVYDNDFLINDSQITDNGAYNESLNVEVNVTNTSFVFSPVSINFSLEASSSNQSLYAASFNPISNNTGDYEIVVNVSDSSGEYSTLSFNLTILAVNSAPVISSFPGQNTSILEENYTLLINASDEEDDRDGVSLNYSLESIDSLAPNLSINSSNGLIEFNFSNNESYGGRWLYNVSVSDSEGAFDDFLFNLTVHYMPNVTFPLSGFTYNLSEFHPETINFSIDYNISGVELRYLLYKDKIVYDSNSSNFSFTNISLFENSTYLNNLSNNLSYNISMQEDDESYSLLKNMTLHIYPEGYPELNQTVNYSINCTHSNDNLSFVNSFSTIYGTVGQVMTVNLANHFYDHDSFDEYYEQPVNFSVNQSDSAGASVSASFSDWVFSFSFASTGVYNLSVLGEEINSSDSSVINNVSSNWFNVSISDAEDESEPDPNPTTGGSSSGGGGGDDLGEDEKALQYFSMRIISPGDFEVTPDKDININFSVVNNGNVDLKGIDLSGLVEIDGNLSDDILTSFPQSYIDSLAVGEKKDYTMNVRIGSEAGGEYRVVINADVTSPKFSDWAEFFIKVESLDKSKLSELLVFTEKFVSENPECLELRELYFRAVESFEANDFEESRNLAESAITACENAIEENEQIKFFDDRVMVSILYSLVITIALLLGGLVYYFYYRIKFKKLIDKDYI